ncbi:MAG TPA: hypothetical protein VF173_00350 [Thermoanaerobaculia bacterium]|nr:hypothetical protein [Thermoanaerobaculia bacterium]
MPVRNSDGETLYSLDELARAAGIAYSTLSTLVSRHGDQIPSEKQGRLRFFPPRALEIVKDLARANKAKQGRKLRRKVREKAASDEALNLLAKATTRLEEVARDLAGAQELLRRNPGSVTLALRTLAPGLYLRRTMDVLIEADGPDFVARSVEAHLSGTGRTRPEAVEKLRAVIVETYRALQRTAEEQWTQELRQRRVLLRMVREVPEQPHPRKERQP